MATASIPRRSTVPQLGQSACPVAAQTSEAEAAGQGIQVEVVEHPESQQEEHGHIGGGRSMPMGAMERDWS